MTPDTMTKTSFSWLHLTDLHFGLKGQDCLWPNLRQPFLDDLAEQHRQSGPWDAVFFTGDLVQQGKSAEFNAMQQEVLDRLWGKLDELGSGHAVLLAVPGNHDLFRPDPKQDNAAVDTLLEVGSFKRIESKFWENPSGTYRTVIKDAFAAYSEWWQAAPHRAPGVVTGILPGDFACTLSCGDKSIGIVGLNTAFLQLGGGDYRGKLVWDTRQLQAVCGGAADDWLKQHDVCLLLTHQGPDWLTPEAKKHGESEIAPAGRFAAHLFGHMHETSIQTIAMGGNPKAIRQWQACSLFGMEKYGEPPTLTRSHGYTAGKISFEAGQASLKIWPRVATNIQNGWRFIPDHQHAVLSGDNATEAEVISRRSTHLSCAAAKASAPITAQATTPHSTLPTRRAFFGRASELAAIAKFLLPDHTGWGVVLDGPGGMGKTALALQAAHLAPAEHYPLKLFISAKQTRLDPDGERAVQDHRVDNYDELLTQIGLALGCDEIQRTPQDKRFDLVRHALAAQRVLLVLDNLESFTKPERRRIYDLLEVLPSGCRAIVTSRRRDETAARTLRLDKLDFDATKLLLAEIGERVAAVAQLSADEQQTLYQETGGNPLLLTWVAWQLGRAQGRCRTVANAVTRLHEAHRQQSINQKNDPLEFIFGDLLDTFTDAETALLGALAHFSAPARLDWLLPMANLSQTAAETALDDLRDRALLIEDETSGSWFLPPLCSHYLRLRRPEAVNASGQRLANLAFALALQHGGYGKAPYLELEAAWPRIEAALPLLIAGDNALLQRLCDALDEFLEFSGRWDAWLGLSQEAEAKTLAAGDDINAGYRAYQAGWAHYLQGDAAAVLAAAERCASHFQCAGAYEQAIALRLRGIGHELLKDYPAAISAQQQALEINRSIAADSAAVTNSLIDLAESKKASGDLDGAEVDLREALRIASKVSDREAIACITGNLAELALQRKDWPRAERLATDALASALALGRQELIGSNHYHLAQALRQQQRASDALPHARNAVAIFTHLRSPDLADAVNELAACEAACVVTLPLAPDALENVVMP